ncbi:hypothetical protein NEISICOT_00330 [Neisseria sicca ATCC 29256]|uniref:Uncharacterized protein n=1 Tax=Neisseria sicca ATCC 29256 TaxID=547045 RepID=C6M1F0_NEISI|nr:hypothetical protein NEISICOT_00330 [Neisseria sicca ATCC 29256]
MCPPHKSGAGVSVANSIHQEIVNLEIFRYCLNARHKDDKIPTSLDKGLIQKQFGLAADNFAVWF